MTFPPPSFFLFKGRGATPINETPRYPSMNEWKIHIPLSPPPLKSYDTSKNSTLIHTQVNPDNQECIQTDRKWRRSIRFMARSLSVKFKCEFCTYTCIDLYDFKKYFTLWKFYLVLTIPHIYIHKNEYKSNTYTKHVLMFLSAPRRRSVTWHESFKCLWVSLYFLFNKNFRSLVML